jgi:hypothetical protein
MPGDVAPPPGGQDPYGREEGSDMAHDTGKSTTGSAQRTASLIPGWTVWQSPRTRLWHARKDGSEPAVLVHDDTLDGLREQARRT